MTEVVTRCPVCHALLDEEDLFCPNCGTEAPHRPDERRDKTRTATYNFECSGCGASMSYDASAGNLRCPFCGSEKLVAQADAKTISPRCVVPFVVTREQAVGVMRQWLGKGIWRPGDLRAQALVVSMTPVFVPYWVFRADTYTFWTADTSKTPLGARASWYPMFGDHRGHYENLLVGASGALTSAETAALAPFDLSPGVEPEQVDLDNITVEQYSVGRKYARPLARSGLESLEASACRQYVPGNCRGVKVNLRLENLASDPVLLPVWMMAYRYRDRVYRFLMNGQTGRSTGEAPVSWRKIAVVVAIALAAIGVVALLASMK